MKKIKKCMLACVIAGVLCMMTACGTTNNGSTNNAADNNGTMNDGTTNNGSTNNVRAISVYDNYATFYFEYSAQTIVFSDIGSEFNGKLVILANPTSLLVCNLLPSARDITDIGDPNEKFNSIYAKTGYFDKLYVNGKEIT